MGPEILRVTYAFTCTYRHTDIDVFQDHKMHLYLELYTYKDATRSVAMPKYTPAYFDRGCVALVDINDTKLLHNTYVHVGRMHGQRVFANESRSYISARDGFAIDAVINKQLQQIKVRNPSSEESKEIQQMLHEYSDVALSIYRLSNVYICGILVPVYKSNTEIYIGAVDRLLNRDLPTIVIQNIQMIHIDLLSAFLDDKSFDEVNMQINKLVS